MKKLLLGVMLLIGANNLLADVYVGVGMNTNTHTSRVKYDGNSMNEPYADFYLSPYIEYSKQISDKTEIGVGYSYSKEKDDGKDTTTAYRIIGNDIYYKTDKAKMPEVESNTFYLTHRYKIYQENELKVYTKAMLGYSFNSFDNDVSYTIHHKLNSAEKTSVKKFDGAYISDGIYYGAGVGILYKDRYTTELLYECREMNLHFNNDKQKYDKNNIKLSFGMKL